MSEIKLLSIIKHKMVNDVHLYEGPLHSFQCFIENFDGLHIQRNDTGQCKSNLLYFVFALDICGNCKEVPVYIRENGTGTNLCQFIACGTIYVVTPILEWYE